MTRPSLAFVGRHLDRQIFSAWATDCRGLALLRIAYATVSLLVLLPFTQSLWTTDYPAVAVTPPPGPMALLPDLIYEPAAVVGLHVVVVAALVLVLVGWRTWRSSVVLAVAWTLVMGIGFSFGKVDHVLLVALVPVLVGRWWGGAWSLDARRTGDAADPPGWVLALGASVLSLAMLSAALPKLRSGWLDPSTAAVHGTMARQVDVHGRDALLAEPVAEMSWTPLLELIDLSTVLFEASLVLLVLSVRRFRWILAVALTFHAGVALTMNIPFVTNVVLYALFVPLATLAARLERTPPFRRAAAALTRLGPRAVIAAAAPLGAAGGVVTWASAGAADDELLSLPLALWPPTLVVLAGGAVGAAVLLGRLRDFLFRARKRRGGVLIYDADCAFCTRFASWAATRMRGSTVEAWQSAPEMLARAGLTAEDCIDASWWIDGHGPPLRGQHAIAHGLVQMGGGLRIAGLLLQLPGISYLSAVGYRLVAENRQLMPGGTAACAVDAAPGSAAADADRVSNIR